ncbi:MAG: hypothetical protein QOI42_1164, partial [Frankiaceae bacterium]|nr:hypothetical protein [Frankiaceae bacterium]
MTLDDDPGARAAVERARALLAVRRFTEAREVLQPALASGHETAEVWCLLGQAAYGQEADVAAMSAASRAIGLQPSYEWGHRLYAMAASRGGNHADADAAARQAVALAPHEWRTHVTVSIVAGRRRPGCAEAVAAARQAVTLAPAAAEAHVVLADALLDAGKRHDARRHYDRALAIDPELAVAHNNRARLQLRGGLSGRVLADTASGFATSMRIDPRSGVGRRNIEIVTGVVVRRMAVVTLLDAW